MEVKMQLYQLKYSILYGKSCTYNFVLPVRGSEIQAVSTSDDLQEGKDEKWRSYIKLTTSNKKWSIGWNSAWWTQEWCAASAYPKAFAYRDSPRQQKATSSCYESQVWWPSYGTLEASFIFHVILTHGIHSTMRSRRIPYLSSIQPYLWYSGKYSALLNPYLWYSGKYSALLNPYLWYSGKYSALLNPYSCDRLFFGTFPAQVSDKHSVGKKDLWISSIPKIEKCGADAASIGFVGNVQYF